ncbi:unnamed protein product [Rotaria sp. Silwood1]|nr:unnamed protein product [Rotaria sp. Silwood1]
MTDYQSSIGNLISISGYLLTSSERSVAHDFATKSAKSEGVVRATFQIDSCEYNAKEDLWHIKVHASDKDADLAAEYIEYQKKKMTESNIALIFGNLLLEMDEYAKAERYFDTILNSSNPNNEEIACIFFNFGRTHRLKGEFDRVINYYHRAYDLHINARPERLASAEKNFKWSWSCL